MVLAFVVLSRGLPTLFCGSFSRSFVAHLNLGQGGNLLSRSLHEGAYDHNPGFKRFIPFRPHPEFKKGDLDARQRLYQQLADLIWSPDRLAQEAGWRARVTWPRSKATEAMNKPRCFRFARSCRSADSSAKRRNLT